MPGGESQGLFNAAGTARRLRTSSLLEIGPARPGPALRRGALVAVPVGAALVVELCFDAPTQGAVATGALLAGFPGLDAPARPRAAWQAASAPAIGLAAALGVLSSQAALPAVLAMGLLGAAAGYCFAVSLRLAIYGLSTALALLVAQGLFLPAGEALPALWWAGAGALLQAAWSLTVWAVADRMAPQRGESGWDAHETLIALRSNLTLSSPAARHAIRFGVALAAGVATYRAIGFDDHGFWVPLTILFVMRPEENETHRRLILRAAGTVLGLVLATALAEAVGSELVIALALTVAAALAFGLLTVQYALFTAAITTYVVLLTDTLGEGPLEAAGLRAAGTAIGIGIAFLAFLVWPNRGTGEGMR